MVKLKNFIKRDNTWRTFTFRDGFNNGSLTSVAMHWNFVFHNYYFVLFNFFVFSHWIETLKHQCDTAMQIKNEKDFENIVLRLWGGLFRLVDYVAVSYRLILVFLSFLFIFKIRFLDMRNINVTFFKIYFDFKW